MKQLTKEERFKIYQSLPQEAKDLFWSDEVIDIMDLLKSRYKIDSNDKQLPRITGLVILGAIPLSKLPQTLSSRTGVDQKKAEKLADDIKRHILFPIKDFLEEAYDEDFSIWEFRAKDEEIERIKKGKDTTQKEETTKKEDPYRENI